MWHRWQKFLKTHGNQKLSCLGPRPTFTLSLWSLRLCLQVLSCCEPSYLDSCCSSRLSCDFSQPVSRTWSTKRSTSRPFPTATGGPSSRCLGSRWVVNAPSVVPKPAIPPTLPSTQSRSTAANYTGSPQKCCESRFGATCYVFVLSLFLVPCVYKRTQADKSVWV